MKVELTAVTLEGLQIFGAKTQRHLTESDECKCLFSVWVEFCLLQYRPGQNFRDMLECIFVC